MVVFRFRTAWELHGSVFVAEVVVIDCCIGYMIRLFKFLLSIVAVLWQMVPSVFLPVDPQIGFLQDDMFRSKFLQVATSSFPQKIKANF